MLKIHAIETRDAINGSIRAKCGRVGHVDRSGGGGKWSYWSVSGETRFQAVPANETADNIPRVDCVSCLRSAS